MYKILSLMLLSVLIFSACSEKQEIPDKTGKEILKEYSKVSSNIKTADFKIHYFYDNLTDEREAYSDTVNILAQRIDDGKSKDFPFAVNIDYGNQIDIIYKDDISYFIDHDKKKMTLGYYDSLEYVLNIQGNWIHNAITELIMPSDFTEMIDNLEDTLEVRPIEEVNGKDCYVVYSENFYAQYGITMIQETWFDMETMLPARSMQTQVSEKDTSKMVTDFFINDIDYEFDRSVLDVEKYADYETEIYKPKEKKELLAKGDKAPDFELVNHEGKTVSLKDYKGKVVLIDFWGTWCVWCVRSFPKLEEAYSKLKDKNVEFLGLSCKEPEDAEPVKFAREKGISYPILLNADPVAEKYNVSGFPTFYIIDKEGNVILAKSGYSDELDQIIIDAVTPYL